MDNNDNKLDILTKKIYEEGIEKAQNDAKDILEKAKKDAEDIIKEAENKAKSIIDNANNDSANLRQKTEAEIGMSVKQAIASLKQQLTNLISNKIAVDMTTAAFKDEEFVRELMSKIIEKWNAEGNSSLNVMMNDKEKAVNLLIDEDLKNDEYIGFHPCKNTSTLKIRYDDLLERFLPGINRTVQYVELPWTFDEE